MAQPDRQGLRLDDAEPKVRPSYSRYVRYIALGVLHAAIRATAVYEVSGARLLTVHTAFTNTCHCTRTSA